MLSKDQMYEAILKDVQFCMYSVMIAEQFKKLGCDNVAWTRDEFRSAITSYPLDLQLDAQFLVGKYESAHNKNICDVYFDILRDTSTNDSDLRRENFAFALVDPLYISQIDDNQAEWPNVGYVLEQPDEHIEPEFLESPYICSYDFYHEPRYAVTQRDLMQFEAFDIDSLNEHRKRQFFNLPLHSDSPLKTLADRGTYRSSVLDFGVVTGIAKALIAHVNAEDINDKTVQRALLASNVAKNREALCIAARMYGSYTHHDSDKDLTTEETLQIRDKHCVLPGEANAANLNGSSISTGMALFDACMGKGDPHNLIECHRDYDDNLTKWRVNPDILDKDLTVKRADPNLKNFIEMGLNP